jgi:predicted nucleotidyltransferase
MTQHGWHDCPTPIRAQVLGLVDAFRALLGEALIGVYLHGSLAMGCFNPDHSDLDLLVLARRPLSLDSRRAAAGVLLRRSNAPRPIEISCLNAEDVRPWRHPAPFDFHFSEDWRERLETDPAPAGGEPRVDPDLAAHLTVARARGLALLGPPPSLAFPAVPPEDYLDSIVGDFEAAHGFMAANPIYFVLNACRVLAFVEQGRVLSKDEGGEWALASIQAEWHGLVRAVLKGYRGQAAPAAVDPALLERFARAMKARITTGAHSKR